MGELKFDLEKAKAICDHCSGLCSEVLDEQVSMAIEQFALAFDRIVELEGCLIENKKRWLAWMNTTDQQIIDKL